MTFKMANFVILFYCIMTIYGSFVVFGSPVSIAKSDSSANTVNSASAGVDTPENNNNSIQYLLYTPEQPTTVCYFEPNVSNVCTFNASYKTKALIHGYTVQLLPGNFFEQIKDTFLKYNKFNVFIVNWTKYDEEPYTAARLKAYPVANNVAKMINFLVSNKGVNVSDVHIIGHSLGAHISGFAGYQILNLGRITGLDPAGPLFTKQDRYNRLSDASANFVDVIHTSNYTTGVGLGLGDAIGWIDIYPNGGNTQPSCKIGGYYQSADAVSIKINTLLDLGSCYHNIVLIYFMNSIHTCNYLSIECTNYQMYSKGRCDSKSEPTDRMGVYCEPIPGLPKESTFYLDTSVNPPYCEI